MKSLERLVHSERSSTGSRLVRERILVTTVDKYGYMNVRLRKFNQTYPFTIHRLVAKHFIPNPQSLPCINHINEDKLDNRVSNLEWCTVDYNNKYNGRQEKINTILRNKDLGNRKVLMFDNKGNKTVFKSIHQASRSTGCSRQEISRCCRGLRGPYKDKMWLFL